MLGAGLPMLGMEAGDIPEAEEIQSLGFDGSDPV
jgi:hypothetical protein